MVPPDRRDFDASAPGWDSGERRVRQARAVAETIRQLIPLGTTPHVLDFGCGTGLLTLELAPHVGRILGIDTSAGMLAVLADKVRAGGAANVSWRQLDLTDDAALAERFHLIVSSMVLHHVADVSSLLTRFHRLLHPGGRVALADLDPEDGTFHANNTGVHHFGFERVALRASLEAVGFVQAKTHDVITVRKEIQGREREYSLFLLTGTRPA